MSQKPKWDYLRAIYSRYRKLCKEIKHLILNEFCQVCGYNRKYAPSMKLVRKTRVGSKSKMDKQMRAKYQGCLKELKIGDAIIITSEQGSDHIGI